MEGLARDHRGRRDLQLALQHGVSEARWLGWEPKQTTTHYDAQGNVTGYSVTETEPEWTPERRDRAEAYQIYEADRCRGCGLHKSVLEDPEHNRFTIEDEYCDVCAAKATHARVKDAEHKDVDRHLGKDPKPTQRRAGDGHHTHMRPLLPSELPAATRTTPPTR